ncbi:acyl-CoA dehydrogenase [Pseudooceanicola nanhaiensis]|jgi:acyl-CoA dehydrogenase|uniref:Acyl-CoA dehydrogenase n=1 Tax=Pseudooceanicola nanhaiensis TaxID=375761 RepID=A0A917SNA6_9RHOB|nr:acyl-CoA dehydrogenase family protein [Pseudooceanicola nanhaiensis]GGL89096.1 acyl-CoA dehydrogenase [Pseudooceanicola nanhaiensis]
MNVALRFDPVRLPDHCQDLRQEVRDFLREQVVQGVYDPTARSHGYEDICRFAKAVSERGWIGMAWPREYGGQERSFLERYVVSEEMLVARAPTRRYFVADRQSGPTLIRYASEPIKQRVLPQIIAGEAMFCIGMSEPNSGSDLFAAQAKATKVDGGWRLNGAKIWTTGAQHADYMIGLFRTSQPTRENRRHGLTSFLVDMHADGIKVSPIEMINGVMEFNEVLFDDVFLPDENVIGEIDGAWKQATSELAYERSGPERFLETFGAMRAFLTAVEGTDDTRLQEGLGRLIAQLHTMRRMSVSVAGMLEAGREPVTEASIVKDLGTVWDQALPKELRTLISLMDYDQYDVQAYRERMDFYTRMAPKLTIQGGTTEILRGIVARGLGLR